MELLKNWRKYNRAIHRDLGYLFFAMTVIYALSGIALNHINEWNPSYIITNKTVMLAPVSNPEALTKKNISDLLVACGESPKFKKYYMPSDNTLKIFVDGGTVMIDIQTGEAIVERINRRPIFHTVNFLHYNPGRWWTWVSDIFAGSLILLAFTGLFILKGKNGITRRGAVLTLLGILIPVVFLILYYH